MLLTALAIQTCFHSTSRHTFSPCGTLSLFCYCRYQKRQPAHPSTATERNTAAWATSNPVTKNSTDCCSREKQRQTKDKHCWLCRTQTSWDSKLLHCLRHKGRFPTSPCVLPDTRCTGETPSKPLNPTHPLLSFPLRKQHPWGHSPVLYIPGLSALPLLSHALRFTWAHLCSDPQFRPGLCEVLPQLLVLSY